MLHLEPIEQADTIQEPVASDELSDDKKFAELNEQPAQFCPLCSAKLESRRCKMVCPRCGYFMSCSEFE
jgi:rubrerythrin